MELISFWIELNRIKLELYKYKFDANQNSEHCFSFDQFIA